MSSLRGAALMAAGMVALLAAGPALAAPEDSVAAQPANAAPQRPYTPVTDAMLQHPDASDWLMWRRTMNSWGFSPLNQINARNVAGLRLMWVRALPPGGFEGTPLVHDGVMYIPEPGDRIEAVDAATGAPLWHYQRKYPADFKGRGGTKRNIAIWGNLLFSSGGDGTVYAVDARTGKEVWVAQVTDYHTQTGGPSAGPMVVNGKVITGRACSVQGGPDACVVVANDAATGKELWRLHTVALPGEPGGDTWGDTPRDKRVTVGTWNPPSFDPKLNLIYFGTSIASPSPKFELAGNDKDYLYETSTIAIDPDTGKIVWHYQHIHDFWDFDHTFERLLVDTEVAPDPKSVPWINPKLKPDEVREVVTGIPGKTGIVYTLDRKTGEFLWARPTVRQNVLQGIDLATGRPINNPAAEFTHHDQALNICPAFTGGKNWPAGAYNPQTHLMLEPLQNICSVVTSDGPKTGPGLLGMNIDYTAVMAPGETNVGTIQAISAVTGRTEWKYQQRAGTMSLVDTGGGVLFMGDAVGYFHGIDDRTGKPLWDVNLSAPISGFPIAYGVGGKEFVAVGTGSSPEASGLGRMTPEDETQAADVLYVFALP
jgi:alcohol dehydrogenase (cytochrome c)